MILNGEARCIPLADESVDCIMTSPPYWGLRDYGLASWCGGRHGCDHKVGRFEYRVSDKQRSNSGSAGHQARAICPKCGAVRLEPGLGLEPTLGEYLEHMRQVGLECWRVLKPHGTLWLNMGDCYAASVGQRKTTDAAGPKQETNAGSIGAPSRAVDGLKPKDLVGLAWRVAFALQADGWYLRSDIIWHKPNPMPESASDRPTKAHEYLFLLAKQPRYYYDAEAIREPHAEPERGKGEPEKNNWSVNGERGSHETVRQYNPAGRNRRTVWTIPTSPYKGVHFATFPPALVELCILAGTSAKGMCPVCGKPWERIVERSKLGRKDYEGKNLDTPSHSAGRRLLAGVRAAREAGGAHDNPFPLPLALGWRPTCDHDAEPIPAIVLDPFCGSGTVGEVCRKHGRRFVGIDLSMEYLRNLALPRAEGAQTAESLRTLPLFGDGMGEPTDQSASQSGDA